MNFYFITHPSREDAARLSKTLADYVYMQGCALAKTPAEADVCVAIGGDGTVVSAAEECSCPILGINAGHVGYLATVEQDGALKAMDALMEGRYRLQKRMRLDCAAEGEAPVTALNEAALLKPDAGAIRFVVKVDGREIELRKKSYTNTESGSVRANIFNQWVSDDGLPSDARTAEGALFENNDPSAPSAVNDGSCSAQIIDPAEFSEWKNVEVGFTVSGL